MAARLNVPGFYKRSKRYVVHDVKLYPASNLNTPWNFRISRLQLSQRSLLMIHWRQLCVRACCTIGEHGCRTFLWRTCSKCPESIWTLSFLSKLLSRPNLKEKWTKRIMLISLYYDRPITFKKPWCRLGGLLSVCSTRILEYVKTTQVPVSYCYKMYSSLTQVNYLKTTSHKGSLHCSGLRSKPLASVKVLRFACKCSTCKTTTGSGMVDMKHTGRISW